LMGQMSLRGRSQRAPRGRERGERDALERFGGTAESDMAELAGESTVFEEFLAAPATDTV
jgi:hypothetical protein